MRDPNEEPIVIYASIITETENAYYLDVGRGQKVWVGKKICTVHSDSEVEVPEWWAVKVGAI